MFAVAKRTCRFRTRSGATEETKWLGVCQASEARLLTGVSSLSFLPFSFFIMMSLRFWMVSSFNMSVPLMVSSFNIFNQSKKHCSSPIGSIFTCSGEKNPISGYHLDMCMFFHLFHTAIWPKKSIKPAPPHPKFPNHPIFGVVAAHPWRFLTWPEFSHFPGLLTARLLYMIQLGQEMSLYSRRTETHVCLDHLFFKKQYEARLF